MSEPASDMEALMRDMDPEFDRIMECVFGLRNPELRVWLAVVELPGSTVTELAHELERDRSTINRSITTLHEQGLVERERRLLGEGGFAFQYYPIPLAEAKERMHEEVDQWAVKVHEQIDSFEG